MAIDWTAYQKSRGFKSSRPEFTPADEAVLDIFDRHLINRGLVDGGALVSQRLGGIAEQEDAYTEALKGQYGAVDHGDPGGLLTNIARSAVLGVRERGAGREISELETGEKAIPDWGDILKFGEPEPELAPEERERLVQERIGRATSDFEKDRALSAKYVQENPGKGLLVEAARSSGSSLFSTIGSIAGGVVGGAGTFGLGAPGGALAGRAAGAAAAGSFAYDTAYLQARESGLNHEQATAHARMIAGTETAGEMVTLPGFKALKPVTNKVLGVLLENPLQEAITEPMQQLGQIAETFDAVNAVGGTDTRAGQELLRAYEKLGTPKTYGEAAANIGHAALIGGVMGTAFTPVSVPAAIREGRIEEARLELEELQKAAKLKLPSVKPTGDKAFDAGQAAGVAAITESRPVDLFGDPVDMPKQVQPELTEFDLEQRKAEAFRMSPAGREAKAREEFAAQETAKRKTLEDNALRTGIRNRLTGQGIDRNVPAQGGLFGMDDETSVPAGKTRIYRGQSGVNARDVPAWIMERLRESGALDAEGRWWSPDPEIARWYAEDAGAQGQLQYQDIPTEMVDQLRVSAAGKDVAKFSLDPYNELFVPKDMVGKGKPVASGKDTPANEAERARSASAAAMQRTPRTLENVPEGPSEAVYSGGEVGPQTSDREAMDRATDFDTDRSLQENDAEAVVKNRKQFFGPLAEEAALVQARLEAKNASPEALKPFKADGDTAQDLGDARERYAQAILPQTRKEEQERREKIYDRALDVVVTGRNRFATSNRGSQESVPAQEQGELDFSGSPAQTGGTTEVEQPSLFTEQQAPVPTTQPKPTEFKSRLTVERERISPAVEKGLKAAAAAEKAERTKAVNEEKAKEDALIAASIADVKKAQPELKGEELKNAVYARIEERRRTGQLPETKKAKSSGPKNRLTKKGKKEAKEAKSKEKAEEARARVTKALENEDTPEIENDIVALSKQIKNTTPERRKQLEKLYIGNDVTPQDAKTIISRVLDDPNLTDDLREVAQRLLNHKSLQNTFVHFVTKRGPFTDQLEKSFGRFIGSTSGASDVLIRDGSWENHGLHPIVILHELVHAATSRIMHDIKNGGGTVVARKAYKDLQTLLITIRKQKQSLDDTLGTERTADKILESPEELLAYANTDPDFRAWLKQENFWDPIINFLAKILGWPTNKVNLLDQILSLGEVIESEQDSAARGKAADKAREQRGATIQNDMTAPAKEDTKFWRWFQNSKVRNPDGTPKLTYHMTNAGPFWKLRKFKTRAADQQLGTHLAADVEVTNDIAAKKALADNIVGKTASTGLVTVPAYLRINNPLRLEDKGAWGPEVIKQLWDQGLIDQKRFADTTKEYIYLRDKNERSRFPADQLPHEVYLQDLIKSLGFDGVVYLNRYEGVSKKDPAGRYLTTKEQDRYEMTDEQFAERYNAYESYIVFDENQIKSATGNSGEYSNDTGFIDEMAEPVFKELDVVRNFDKNEAQLSPELTGFRRQVAQWLSSTGKDTAAAREAKDSAVQDRAGQFVQLSQSRNRMSSMLSNANLTPEALKEENLEKLKTSHPAIYNEYKKVRQITRALGLRLARDYKKFNEKNMTEKDWNVLGKILDNDEYFRRTYKKNAPGGLGKKYSLNLLKQAAKDPTSEAAKTVTAAKQLLVDDFLMFPDTWDKTTIKHLRRLHALWTGREPTGLKREEIIDVLEKYRDTTPEVMNEMADNWVLDLLDLRDPNSKIASFFKPGALNKSILLPRENVPEAIRDLWGENKDPLTKLYSTWSALAVATSQVQYLNSEFERANGKFLFDAQDNPDFDRKRNSVQISAAGMGPLSNMFTTPRYKETVEMFVQAQEATMSALLAVRPSDAFVEKLPSGIARTVVKPVARLTKYLATVGSLPGNYLMNALGAPMNMILNGNFNAVSPSFYKNVHKSLKGMRDAIAAYERKEINSETLELLVNGILDSSFVGELQESERTEMEREITSQGFSETTHGFAKLKDWRRMVKSSATDVYAVMDLYAKAANYYAEKHFLKKFYERRGIQKTEKQLQKDAAERIKRTNLTYTRAAALLKASEGVGLSMFLTYFGETWRTAYNNYEVGINDIRLGMRLKDTGLIRHGTARVAGATAALFASKAILAMYALPYKFIFGAAGALFGDDDDKEQMIQDGMGDFYEGRILSLLNSGPNGIKSFVDVGRLDPNDPVSTPIRHLAEGNVEEAMNSIKDLYLVNTAVSRGLEIAARRILGTREAKPTMANRTPAVYKAFFDLMTDAGASPRLANELIRGSETVNPLWPPAFSNLYEGLNNEEKPANRNALDGLGLRVVDYDPVSTVRSEYMRKVKSPTDNAFNQIREYLQFGEELDDNAVEEMYLDAVANEYEGFIDASKAVKGALASGASRTSLREGLKEAGVSDEAASSLLNGRFMPRSFSDQFLDGVEAQLVQRAATFGDKSAAKQDVRMLRQKLRMINAKYRNFIPEE